MIGSLMSRMEDAQKLSIPQLQKSIQDGVLPAYIGIPLLQDKIKQAQSAQSPQQPQQPPIAQQVLQQAKQIESGIIPQQQMSQQPPQQPLQMAPQPMPQGIDSAESNLPTEMAEGGIVGFANGGVTGGGEMQLTVPINIGGEGGSGPYTGFGGGGFGGGGGGYAPPGGPQGGSAGSLASLGRGAQQMQPPGAASQAQGVQAQGAQMNMQENSQAAQGASADVNGFTPIQTNQGTLLAGQFLQGLSGIPQDQKAGGAMGSQYGMQQGQSAPYQNVSDSIGPNFQGFAKGGPVGYARGSIIDDEDDDIDPTEDFRTASKMFARDPMEQRRESASILGMGDSIRPMLSSFTQPISDFASGIKSKFINKTPEVDIVTKPQVQPEGGIPGIIASKAQKYNLPPQLMSSIAKAESNFNPNAGNKTGSSAKGLYQFIDKTWTGMGGKPGEQFDPEINSELGAKYIRQNAEFLKNKLGRDPSYSEVYAAHYFGPSGASNLLTRASPKDSIEKGLATFNDPKGVRLIMKQNPNLKGKTVGQVLNDLERKTGSGIVSLAQGGQIKHFIKGGMLFDDFMGGAPYEEFNKPNAITPEEIRKNQAAQKAAERARNAARIGPPKPLIGPTVPTTPTGIASSPKISPQLASRLYGSTIGRLPLAVAGAATVAGLDALTGTDTGTASNELDPIAAMQATHGGYDRQDENRFKSITDRLFPQGFSAPAVVKPEVKPEAKPVTKPDAKPVVKPNVNPVIDSRESANARALIESGKNDQARRDALFADYGDTSANEDTELGANVTQQMSNMPTQPTTKEEEKKPYSFEDYLADMQAKRGEIKSKKDEDKYMSLLAAGLGMMSGTSQFAGANIGKGALAGVQDYRDTQKQRAAELAAVDKEIGSGLYRKTVGDYYKSGILTKDEKAKRDQAALEEKIENSAYTQYNMINKAIDNQVIKEMALLQDSIEGQTMPANKVAAETAKIRQRLEQANKPLLDSLLKKMKLEMPNLNTGTSFTGNRFNFEDIPNKK